MKKPLIDVRSSPVHGSGVFALRHIPKGMRIVEYIGERISHRTADHRYEDHDENDNHTFLFIVDRHVVIDAAAGGNEARFINHHCDGNCEAIIENRRVFIEALRDIAPGEELGYDYEIGRAKDDPPNIDEIYACRCGAQACRGSMLWPPKKPQVARKKRTARHHAQPVRPKAGKRVVRRQPARSRKSGRS